MILETSTEKELLIIAADLIPTEESVRERVNKSPLQRKLNAPPTNAA